MDLPPQREVRVIEYDWTAVRPAPVRPVGTPAWLRWVGRVLVGIIAAMRAVLIYGEVHKLCPPPAGAETEGGHGSR